MERGLPITTVLEVAEHVGLSALWSDGGQLGITVVRDRERRGVRWRYFGG